MVYCTGDNVFEEIDAVAEEEIEVAIFKIEVGVAVLDDKGEVGYLGVAAVLSCCEGDDLAAKVLAFADFLEAIFIFTRMGKDEESVGSSVRNMADFHTVQVNGKNFLEQ